MSVANGPSAGVEVIRENQEKSRAPWLAVVVVIVAAVLAGLGVRWLIGTGSDSESTEPKWTEPGAVFSWDGDDLSAWVTEDEMRAALEHVSTLYAGADLEGEVVLEHDEGTNGWSWSTGPVDVDMRNR